MTITIDASTPAGQVSPLLYGLITEEINHIETDILGKDTGDTRVPGPLTNPAEKQAWRIDPHV